MNELREMSVVDFSENYEALILVNDSVNNESQEDVESLINNVQFQQLSPSIQAALLSSPQAIGALVSYFSATNPDGSAKELINNPNGGAYFNGSINIDLNKLAATDANTAAGARVLVELLHELGHFILQNQMPTPVGSSNDHAYVFERSKFEVRADSFALNIIAEIVKANPSFAQLISPYTFGYGVGETHLNAARNGQGHTMSEAEIESRAIMLLNQNIGLGVAASVSISNWNGTSSRDYIEQYLDTYYGINKPENVAARKSIYDNVRATIFGGIGGPGPGGGSGGRPGGETDIPFEPLD